MKDFSESTVREATAHAEAYARGAPLRAAWLGREVAATGGDVDAAVGGVDGLPVLWRWFADRLRNEGASGLTLAVRPPSADPQAGERPPWHAERPNRHVSDGALWLVDAIGCHLAGLARRAIPEASWSVHRAPSRRDIDDRRTVLTPVAAPKGHVDPARMVYGLIVGYAARDEPLPDDDALIGLLTHTVGDDPALLRRIDETGAATGARGVPPLPGPAPDLPRDWSRHDELGGPGVRLELAGQLAQLPGLGIEPGGAYEGRPPRPGERAIALFDDVRVLVGDEAIDGLADRLASVPGVSSTRRTRREYVDVVGTITDEQLRAAVIVDLALHADP